MGDGDCGGAADGGDLGEGDCGADGGGGVFDAGGWDCDVDCDACGLVTVAEV